MLIKQPNPKRTQKTKTGYKIPIPKRGDFLRNLTKAANASPPPKRAPRAKPKD
jgi:hypothetical protein